MRGLQVPLGATAGGGTNLAHAFAALSGHRAGSGLGEPAAPSRTTPSPCPMGIPPCDWEELLGPTRWHSRCWHCSGSQAPSRTCFFDVCGTMAGLPLMLAFLSIPGLHTAGRRLAHPGGCRIDQLNAELMMREVEQGALGTLQRPLYSFSCSCQKGSSCPQACPGLPVCAMLQLWLPVPTAGAHAPGVHSVSAHIPEGCRGHPPMDAELAAPSSPGGEGYVGACVPSMCPLGGCASTA